VVSGSLGSASICLQAVQVQVSVVSERGRRGYLPRANGWRWIARQQTRENTASGRSPPAEVTPLGEHLQTWHWALTLAAMAALMDGLMSSLSPAGDHSSGDPVSNVLSAHPTRERGRIESARVYPERFVVLEKHHLSLCTREGRES
jgi:hypothetical protein